MAQDRSALDVLRSTDATPIAQLCPDIPDATSRVIDGVVTITWPYSVVTKTIAFVLAEHDFRLRRQKGQLRVEFQGAAAEALAHSRVGGGDEVRVSLDGAKWDNPQAPTRLPAGTLEWQLTFSNRLLLDVRRGSDEASDVIDVRAPDGQDAQCESRPEPNDKVADETSPSILDPQSPRNDVSSMDMAIPESVAATPSSNYPPKRPAASMLGPDEYASPAFLKRARVSYGALFEGGFDIFDEEKQQNPKQKRRHRFSMQNTAWKIASRSPSPEADKTSEHVSDDEENAGGQAPAEPAPSSATRTPMVDEGCQTQEEYQSPSRMDVQVTAEPQTNGSMLRLESTSATPGALPEVPPATFKTPSRTLFERRLVPDEPLVPPVKLDLSFAGSESQHDYRGSMTDSNDAVPIMLEAPPPPSPLTTAPFGATTPAPGYPLETFDSSDLTTTTLHVDPNLGVQDVMPTPAHMFYDAPAPGEAEWHPGPLPGEDALSSTRSNSHHSAIVAQESSPVRRQPHQELGDLGDAIRAPFDPGEAAEALMGDDASQADQGDESNVPAEESEDSEDVPGEDYDLRNYDRAKDDDDASDEDSQGSTSDVEKQVIDLSGEDEDDEIDSQEVTSESERLRSVQPGGQVDNQAASGVEVVEPEPDASSAAESVLGDEGGTSILSDDHYDDSEGYDEEYDDEHGYGYDEDEEDDEPGGFGEDYERENMASMAPARPAPTAFESQEPVFIDLLSDSEDEDKPQPAPKPPTEPDSHTEAPEPSAPSSDPAHSDAAEPQEVQELDHFPHSDAVVEAEGTPFEHVKGNDQDQAILDSESLTSQAMADVGSDRRADAPEFSTEEKVGSSQLQREDGSPLGESREDDSQSGGKGSVASKNADTKDSAPMDVDETPIAEEAMGSSPDHFLRPSLQDSNMTGQSERVDEDMEDLPAHRQPDIPTLDMEPVEPQSSALQSQAPRSPATHEIVQMGQVTMETSDSLLQDAQSPEQEQALDENFHQATNMTLEAGAEEVTLATSNDQTEDSETPAQTETKPENLSAADLSEGNHQPPTPSETQLKDNTAQKPAVEDETPADEEDGLAAEAQIMTEFQESQSPAKRAAVEEMTHDLDPSASQSGSVMMHDQTANGGEQETEVFLSLYSLRSRTHKRTASRETVESQEDPTVRLARAPTPDHLRQAPTQEETSPRKIRVAGRWGSPSDPSVRLAMAPDWDSIESEEGVSSKTLRKKADAPRPTPAARTPSPTGKRRLATPEVTRELRSKTQEAVRGSTPDTVSESMLKSPSVASSMPEDEDMAALKRNLQKQLRTALPDYLPLRSLRSSLNKTIDMLAVATMAPPQPHRPKSGPRDYMMEILLTDPSTSPSSVVVAHLFRPHLKSLPTIKAGDVVLLRRMQVVSVKGRGFGVRAGDASAWAVFEKADEEMLPQITGPPVEVTDGEVEYAQGLRRWWSMQDGRALERIEKATLKASQAGKGDAR